MSGPLVPLDAFGRPLGPGDLVVPDLPQMVTWRVAAVTGEGVPEGHVKMVLTAKVTVQAPAGTAIRELIQVMAAGAIPEGDRST